MIHHSEHVSPAVGPVEKCSTPLQLALCTALGDVWLVNLLGYENPFHEALCVLVLR